MRPGDAISEFGVMKLGDELMLFGCVSGVKIGEFSAIVSNIKWCEQPTLTKEFAVCRMMARYSPTKGIRVPLC